MRKFDFNLEKDLNDQRNEHFDQINIPDWEDIDDCYRLDLIWAEHARVLEEARIVEEKVAEEERLDAEKKAEERRLAEEKRKAKVEKDLRKKEKKEKAEIKRKLINQGVEVSSDEEDLEGEHNNSESITEECDEVELIAEIQDSVNVEPIKPRQSKEERIKITQDNLYKFSMPGKNSDTPKELNYKDYKYNTVLTSDLDALEETKFICKKDSFGDD